MAIPLTLQADEPWPGPQVDPYLRLAVALMETQPQKAGALLGLAPKELDLLVELTTKDGAYTVPADLVVPKAYEGMKYVTGTLVLSESGAALRDRVAALRAQVARLKLAVRQQPRLAKSLEDMGPPGVALPWKAADGVAVDGSGVVIGIIDDGCALAHHNFLRQNGPKKSDLESRILCLWDQTEGATLTDAWSKPLDFGYGRELKKKEIDDEIAKHVRASGSLPQDEVHTALGYAIETGSHGTHVMDIAAGNGRSSGSPGVAPCADIIFVQIPQTAIGNPADSVLSSYLLDGINYIFARAAGKPAVINISYGGYGGPHDGTSLLECAIDELLKNAKNRAVVISAGNSFDLDCHATGEIEAKQRSPQLRWMVGGDDPTLNLMEIWYDKKDTLKLELTPPGAVDPLEVGLDQAYSIRQDNKIVGWVFHRDGDSGNNDRHVLIALRPSRPGAADDKVAPAPSGDWGVQLCNDGLESAKFHAWIERDDAGRRKHGNNLQSRFKAEDVSPEYTLGSFAGGRYTISVGAYNTATQEVSSYSACGPTRDGRPKPDVCAPAAEDEKGKGVLSAAALRGDLTPMNGTSAAAPHVAGLVALVLQAAHRTGKALTTGEILELIKGGASKSVKPDSGSPASAPFLAGRIGAGKVIASATLAKVP
jgi:subtilisin family serine protease